MGVQETITEELDRAAEDTVVLRRPGRLLLWFAAGFAALAVALTALPDNPYVRFQTLSQTIHSRVQWSYERIHFDPTPIDIAVIGNSRLEAGVNAPALSAALSERLGREVHVVNLSTPQEGRNLHWVMARELIEAHPEVSLIVLSLIEQEPRVSHPAFADLGGRRDILTAPVLINREWLSDLARLPYRQVKLFVQSTLPELFGLSADFDPATYSGSEYDTTTSFTLFDGRVIDRDSVVPKPELRAAAEARVRGISRPLLPDAFADQEFAVERDYTRRIAALAQDRGVELAFLYLPIYGNEAEVHNRDFYAALGPVFEARQFIDAPSLFSDYGHLNRAGALSLVPWLADALAAAVADGSVTLGPPS